MSYAALIAMAGILFGLMLVTALATRKGGVRKANLLLTAALLCMLSYLLGLVCTHEKWLAHSIIVPALILPIVVAPALLLGYCRALTRPGYRITSADLAHLLPLVIFILLLVFVTSDNNGASSESILEATRGGWPPHKAMLVGVVLYLIQVGYFARALHELLQHRKRVSGEFSYEEAVTLRWLRILVGLALFLASFGLLVSLARMLPGVELWPRTFYSMSMVLLMYYLVGFMAIYQPAIFSSDDHPEPLAENDAESPKTKYETSALPDDLIEKYWEVLQDFMTKEQPYLDNQLRIADLAELMNMPAHLLSQTINRSAKQSFFEFINRWRVEEAKRLLTESDHSITAITFDAGFNSESAFYRHFKKVTGKTPKQYRRNPT